MFHLCAINTKKVKITKQLAQMTANTITRPSSNMQEKNHTTSTILTKCKHFHSQTLWHYEIPLVERVFRIFAFQRH